ncbi:unnamed protein product [Choristocarpus tenellus]
MALEMATGYAMVRSETVRKWERYFLAKGHVNVSEQGRCERRYVLGLNEDILVEVKEWVCEHTGRKGGEVFFSCEPYALIK